MNEDRHGSAGNLLDFATCVLKTWHSEVNRLLFVLNRAQAYKWLEQEATCQKILSNEDWSAVDDKISLGVAVLKDDFDKAVRLMNKLADGAIIPKDAYRDWPIFKQFRKTPQFKTTYKQIFGEEFMDVPDHTITFHFEWDVQNTNDSMALKPS